MAGDDERQSNALSGPRCRELLAGTEIGRVAWQAADGPQILPVLYTLHGETVLFKTSPYGPLSDLIRPTEVAMEVDQLDAEHRSGWSVLVRGRAEAASQPAELSPTWALDGIVPWAPGARSLVIAITPRIITGRVFRHRRVMAEPRETT